MFNVKRNGSNVEITDIPQSIPFSVFKNIANETGAVEILTRYFKDKTEYEVTIQHTNENMADTVAWMALKASEPVADDIDVNSTKGKVSAHVFAEFPEKAWTKEQLDEWKNYRKKENREAELYILKTRTGLASLIEELHRTEVDFANSPATGRMISLLRKNLRNDVRSIVYKLMMLI
ncbi:hypothetical protein HHY41_004374 [Salmonella enterica]|nr:hypothetical protein [Salmonella enterica]ECD3472120.1 hypothetical protein [Salmonella enterica subsp. enterica serovar Oranienburg]EDS2896433.1 hypothetical protein [Salmonella enterica]EGG8579484.1 hypothetical protein [Salmonella enterica]EJF7455467.1 hypothetical protein [Salmonella enterica]